jgi:hypothetical protein
VGGGPGRDYHARLRMKSPRVIGSGGQSVAGCRPVCSSIGSVSARASKYSWLDEGRDFSGGFQHTQNRCGAAKEVKSAVVGGHWLIGPGAGTEKVT